MDRERLCNTTPRAQTNTIYSCLFVLESAESVGSSTWIRSLRAASTKQCMTPRVIKKLCTRRNAETPDHVVHQRNKQTCHVNIIVAN